MPRTTKLDVTKWLIGMIALALPELAQAELADAQELHRQLYIMATVGNEARIYSHLRLTQSCGHGPIPAMTVVKPPSIGELSMRVETVTMIDPNVGNWGTGAHAQAMRCSPHTGAGIIDR
jgi:hypothetical protein